MKKLFSIIIFSAYWLLISNSFAQVTRQWAAIYNSPENLNDTPGSLAVDDSGNVFVTGESGGSTLSCITTVKYNTSGIRQWTARYFSNSNEGVDAHSIKLDKSGNVYVTGGVFIPPAQNGKIITIKYNSSGIQQWVDTYSYANTGGWGSDIAIDSACNIYVTGSCNMTENTSDIVTIKYDSSGVRKWVNVYNGPANYIDFSSKILVDRYGNLYVKGLSWVTQLFFEYTIIKYNSAGVQQWVIRQFGSDNTSYYHGGMALDRLGNVYLAASSGAAGMQSYITAKYNPAGYVQWMTIYNSGGLPSQSETSSIVLDEKENVYVTGNSITPSNLSLQGCVTIKYNQNGEQQWVKVFNGNNYTAAGTKIVNDLCGGIYVLGYVDNGGSAGYDYLLIKYDSTGNQKWFVTYDGPGGNTDMPKGMAVDKLKNIYVTGWCGGLGGSTDFATIKYSQLIGIEPISSEVPKQFSLYQNYPNPFNPNTKIKFSLPFPSEGGVYFVSLIVYDVLGKEVASLIPPLGGGQEGLNPGTYEVEFNASAYPSGVYFYKLSIMDASAPANGTGPLSIKFSETKKMVLLK